MTTHRPYRTARHHLLKAVIAGCNKDYFAAIAESLIGILAFDIEQAVGEHPLGEGEHPDVKGE